MATTGNIYSSYISNFLCGLSGEVHFKMSDGNTGKTDTLFAKNAFDSIPDGSIINKVNIIFDGALSRDNTSRYIGSIYITEVSCFPTWDGAYNGYNTLPWNSKQTLWSGEFNTGALPYHYSTYTHSISGVTLAQLKAGLLVSVGYKYITKGILNYDSDIYVRNFHVTVDYTVPTYYLDLNGMLDGASSGGISPYGTADVYINGSLVSQGVSDYYAAHTVGTTYEIKNIKANDGYRYNGVYSGSLSGALTAATSVVLSFSTRVPCTVTYNGNGATSGSVASQSGNVGESLTLAKNGFEKIYKVSFNRNDEVGYLGYKESKATFQGWYTAASGGTKVGDGGASYTPTGNTTLYAHWSTMSAVTLDTPERDGYTFLGWYTAAEGGTKIGDGGTSYTPSENTLLYAHWEKINVPPEITSAAITYGGAQVSANNKVPSGEGYLIAVGIK